MMILRECWSPNFGILVIAATGLLVTTSEDRSLHYHFPQGRFKLTMVNGKELYMSPRRVCFPLARFYSLELALRLLF